MTAIRSGDGALQAGDPSAPPLPDDLEPDYRWVIRLWLIVAAFGTVTLVRSIQIGIPLRDPHGEILRSRLALSFGLFVILAVVDASRRVRRDWHVRTVVAELRRRWTRHRLLLAASGLLAYHLVYFCYHNLKSWDAFNRPRDAMLASWDRWLFFGHTPAVLLHHLLGEHLAAYVLMVIYESFSSLLSVALVAAVVLPNRARESFVFLASGAWVWIFGVASYYLIPSVGPFHSSPQDFAGLPHTMIQGTQASYMAQRASFLAHPHVSDAFAQVSAFASLHVAVTTFLLLMAHYYRLRRTTWAMVAFLIGTMTATVYLGWHFAVDDLAGLVIAFVAVGLGRLTIYPRRPLP